ncbi:uncharacterized protein LOC101863661 [Aplysia californica]|uniref:Uncharacterized protein LOC101863661 n=1 Tax=Aplysia californica TaxID=6500 RepID=A0ABM0JKA4_APLCA|nr:uncharacterized protein LOC101863661 [Aplysia californica]
MLIPLITLGVMATAATHKNTSDSHDQWSTEKQMGHDVNEEKFPNIFQIPAKEPLTSPRNPRRRANYAGPFVQNIWNALIPKRNKNVIELRSGSTRWFQEHTHSPSQNTLDGQAYERSASRASSLSGDLSENGPIEAGTDNGDLNLAQLKQGNRLYRDRRNVTSQASSSPTPDIDVVNETRSQNISTGITPLKATEENRYSNRNEQPNKYMSAQKKERMDWFFKPHLHRVICVYDIDDVMSNGRGFSFDDFRSDMCSDLNYQQATLSELASFFDGSKHKDPTPSFIAINNAKVKRPDLRTFLTIGESDKWPSFTDVVTNEVMLHDFSIFCAEYLRFWGFDGLIVNWLKPKTRYQHSSLLDSLSTAFSRTGTSRLKRLLLSAYISGAREDEHLYEPQALEVFLDQVNIMMPQPFDKPNDVTKLNPRLFRAGGVFPTASQKCVMVKVYSEDGTCEGVVWNNTQSGLEAGSSKESNQSASTNSSGGRSTGEMIECCLSENKTSGQQVTPTSTPLPPDYLTLSDRLGDGSRIHQRSVGGRVSQQTSVKESLRLWTWRGLDKDKANVVISLSGFMFQLSDPHSHGIGAPVDPQAEKATLSFDEVCVAIDRGGTVVRDSSEGTPYWYNSSHWMTYEDPQSLAQKLEYLIKWNVGGIMLTSQSQDDISGQECDVGPFPLSSLVYRVAAFHLDNWLGFGEQNWRGHCEKVYARGNVARSSLVVVGLSVVMVVVVGGEWN